MPDDDEWLVDEIVGHRFNGRSIEFNVQWTAGDHTWEPYGHVKDLEALDHYYAHQGVTRWQQLGRRADNPSKDPFLDPQDVPHRKRMRNVRK
jgi:hypothetical protein